MGMVWSHPWVTGPRKCAKLAERVMMDVVLLDSAVVFVGLVYVAIRMALRHSRQSFQIGLAIVAVGQSNLRFRDFIPEY